MPHKKNKKHKKHKGKKKKKKRGKGERETSSESVPESDVEKPPVRTRAG